MAKLTSSQVYGDLTITGNANVIGTITGILNGNAATATALTTSAGSATLPVYFSGGKPVATGTSLAVSVTGSSASCTGNASTATMPLGFSTRSTGVTWGVTTGTSFTCWGDSSGGSVDFRSDCPSAGKTSIKVDGLFYQNEGSYMCLDTSNYTSYVSKIGTSTVGSSTTPIYLNAGTPTSIGYTISKSVPSNAVFTDTTYTASTGLTLSGTAFSLAASGVTAGSYGPSANATLTFDGTFTIPYVTIDAYGRVTASSTKTMTMPAKPNTTNYYPTAFAWADGTSSGPTGTLSGSGMSDVSFAAIPSATASVSGIVTTAAQIFAGSKTFTESVNTCAIEFNQIGSSAGNGGYINFHFNGSTADYTSRIIESSSGALTATGTFTATGGVYNACYNDYAECFENNNNLIYEDVKNKIIELDENGNLILASKNSKKVIGVVSDNFGMLLGGTPEEAKDNTKLPIGLVGTLWVKTLNENISNSDIGKFIISDDEGYGIPVKEFESGMCVGKIIKIDVNNKKYKIILQLS